MVADRIDDHSSHAEFLKALFEVQSNRFIAPPRPERKKVVSRTSEPRKVVQRQVEVKPVAIKFIWLPRAKWSDSRDIYDTEECELKRFNNDWKRACEIGMANLIDGADDEYEDIDGDGLSDEVTETKAVLWDCHDLFVQIFDVYAANGKSISESVLPGGLNERE